MWRLRGTPHVFRGPAMTQSTHQAMLQDARQENARASVRMLSAGEWKLKPSGAVP